MTTTEVRRAAVAVAAVSALVVLAAGCGEDDAPGPGGGPSTTPAEPTVGATGVPTSTNGPVSGLPRPDVTFSAEVSAGAGQVVVTYRLANEGAEPVVVPDLLPEPSGATLVYRSGTVWATQAGEHGVVLAHAFLGRPDTVGAMGWEQIPRVGVTTVEPGDTLAVTTGAPVPLRWHHPWGDDFGGGPISLPEDPATVTFCLGVTPASEAGVRVDDGVATADQETLQHLLCSATVALDPAG